MYVLVYTRAVSQEHATVSTQGKINETAALICYFFKLKRKRNPLLSRSFIWRPSISIPPQTEDIMEPPWPSSRFFHCWEAFTSHLGSPLPGLHIENLFLISLERKLKPWSGVAERQQPQCYSRRLSYMLLDWAQILKGSGFFCPVLSVWSGAGASAGGYSGSACVLWLGDAVWRLRWLETLCWELFWLSFLSRGCWK